LREKESKSQSSERKYIGGHANIACLPSKNIIHSRESRIVLSPEMEFGITHDGFAIDMAGVRERKRKMVRWPERHVYGKLQEHGSRVHIGNGPVPGSENSGSPPWPMGHTSTAGHDRILGFTASRSVRGRSWPPSRLR